MLSEAKHLGAPRARPFAEFTLERSEGLRVTPQDRACSLNFIIGPLSYITPKHGEPQSTPLLFMSF